jgi:hypothetical protein
MQGGGSLNWWETRGFAAAVMLAAMIPLLWPAVPPLTDLPGHIGRYRVAMDLAGSPVLQRYYDFHWTLVGNLGVDLIVVPLGRLIGLEPAVKLIVLLIPPLTVGGMLVLARQIHGRIPPTALLALPLAFAWPFQFGFVNYCLATSLCLYAAALWLRLGGAGRLRLRAVLFLVISFLIWLCHAMAWGAFGLTIFAFELIAARDAGKSWPRSLLAAALGCLPLAVPLAITALWWTSGPSGVTGWPWGLVAKAYFLIAVLRNHLLVFDLLCTVVIYTAIAFGLLRDHLRIEPRMGLAALLVFAAFAAMPNILLGAAYADMRLLPYALTIAVLGIDTTKRLSPRRGRTLALAAAALFALRMADQTWSYVVIDRGWQEQAAAIERMPPGARVFALAAVECNNVWSSRRMHHLDGFAIARREAFTNGQWPMPGGKLLTIIYLPARGFDLDPSQLMWPDECQDRGMRLPDVLARLPRGAFDYLWLIDLEPERQPSDPGLVPVWRGPDRGVLYRIAR